MTNPRPGYTSTITAIGALLLLAACSTDHDSPEDLGHAIADAATTQNTDTLNELTCAKNRKDLTADFDLATARKTMQAPDLELTVELDKTQRNGTTATLTFTTTFENLPEQTLDMDMPTTTRSTQRAINNAGRWIMCNP